MSRDVGLERGQVSQDSVDEHEIKVVRVTLVLWRDVDDLVAEDFDVEREWKATSENALPIDAEESDARVDVEPVQDSKASNGIVVIVVIIVIASVVGVGFKVLGDEFPLSDGQKLLAEVQDGVAAVLDFGAELNNSPDENLKSNESLKTSSPGIEWMTI